MGVNRVLYGDTSVIDLTDSTVDAEHLAEGYTAYDKSGDKIIGTMPEVGGTVKTMVAIGQGTTSISFPVEDRPKMFAIQNDVNITASQTRTVTSVIYTGLYTAGNWVYQSGNKSWGTIYRSTSYFTWTYSNGILTVNTSSTTNGGIFKSGTNYLLTYVY